MKRFLLSLILVVVAGTAYSLTVTNNNFVSGQPIVSAEIDQNFDEIDTAVTALEDAVVAVLLTDANADGDYGDDLTTLWDTLAQQAAAHDQSQMIIQLPCGEIQFDTTAVLGNSVTTNNFGITLQGCGAGLAAGVNPRAGSELTWDGADAGGPILQLGDNVNDTSKSIVFRDFALACEDQGTGFIADTGMQLLGVMQNISLSNVSFHECTGAAFLIGTGTSSDVQADTISLNDVYFDEVSTCVTNSYENAVQVGMIGGRCRFDDLGFDIMAGDINLFNVTFEGPSCTNAVMDIGEDFRNSTITSSGGDTACDGIITSTPATGAQGLRIINSRISSSTTDSELLNWTNGGWLDVQGSKFAGTNAATGMNIIVDPAVAQDLYLYWGHNHIASSVDLLTVDYEDVTQGNVIAAGDTITADDCSAPDGLLGTAAGAGYPRGTICTEAGGSQYYCNATDTLCMSTGWSAITVGSGGTTAGTAATYVTDTADDFGVGWDTAGELYTDFRVFLDAAVGAVYLSSLGTDPGVISEGNMDITSGGTLELQANGVIEIETASTGDITINAGTNEILAASSLCDVTGCAGDWNITTAGVAEVQSIQDADAGANWSITAAGVGTFAGAVTAASFTSDPSATPSVDLKDSDMGGTEDVNARIQGNCPTGTTAGGDEDCDIAFSTQVAGTLTEAFRIDTTDAGVQSIVFAAVPDLTAGADADSAVVQSDSGLELVSGYLTLIRGCADNEILKWDETEDDWNCEADSGAAGGDSITVDTVAVVDPDFASTGDIDFVDTSNTITANLNIDVVAAAEMADADHGDVAWSSGNATVEAVQGVALTSGEATQIATIDATTIEAADWTALAAFSSSILPVANGGTGATTLTDGGILLGSGTGAITALGAATNGQIPIGDGTTDPVLATLTGTANEITVTNGAGSITIDIPTDPTLGVANMTGSLDLGTGTIRGEVATQTSSSTSITFDATDVQGDWHELSPAGAANVALPNATAGMNFCVYVATAQVVSLDPDTGDTITARGISPVLDASDELDSGGTIDEFVCLISFANDNWTVLGTAGTWVDGGAS